MGIFYNPNMASNGLVFCIDVLNPKSYSGSGNNWNDVAGGRVGTLANSPTFNQNYLSFNGVNQNLSFSSSIEVQTAGFTIGFLMRVPASQINGVNWCFLFADRDFGAGDYETGIYGVNNTNFIFKENASTPNTISTSLGTGWNYLVYGMNTNLQPFIYLNGELKVQSSSTFVSSTLDFTHLFSRNSNTNYFLGDFSLVHLYNRELSTSEIKNNFQTLRGRFGI